MSILMVDASHPGSFLPKGTKVIAGYIGGRTPHIWTNAEWNRYKGLKRLPIWVYSGAGGVQDAFACLQAIFSLGIPRNSRIVLDMETWGGPSNRAAVLAFGSVLRYFGYKVWVYGSASTILKLPALDGYWVADWTNEPHMYIGPLVRATQYRSSTVWDYSLVKGWIYQWSRTVWWRG